MPADRELLLNKLKEMKDTYEEAIRKGEYTSLIRSKKLINLLHEYVIEELVSEKFARLYTFEELSIKDFFEELYKTMMERYYLLGFRQDYSIQGQRE